MVQKREKQKERDSTTAARPLQLLPPPDIQNILLHIWASAELMHNLFKMMVVADSAGDAS
jgi:hypothetical protein